MRFVLSWTGEIPTIHNNHLGFRGVNVKLRMTVGPTNILDEYDGKMNKWA